MKTKNVKLVYFVVFAICFFSVELLFAQQGLDQIESQIRGYSDGLKKVVNAVLGLAAIGGGVYTYFKVQNDDGGSGKKAIGNYVLALIFGGVLFTIINVFFGK